jgi:hypothetical protein
MNRTKIINGEEYKIIDIKIKRSDLIFRELKEIKFKANITRKKPNIEGYITIGNQI